MNNKELNKNKYDIKYTKTGNYYVPKLVFNGTGKGLKLGKYGRLRLQYLQQNKKAEYTILWMNDELEKHLIEIDETANKRFKLLMKQYAKRENITEELKADNQLEWVGKMNNIKNAIEEIIFKELIYV